MPVPRPHAAKLAARLLLQRLWIISGREEPTETLRKAPEAAAQNLRLTVRPVAAILNDRQIAGEMDRRQRTILVSTRFPVESQRFTLAHELGHFILHPGKVYFRDRELAAPDLATGRPYYEIEADAFAAEFLIPTKHLEKIFAATFGAPIEGLVPAVHLAEAVSVYKGKQWTAAALASVSPLERARAIASATSFKGRFFTSLSRQFKVSRTAMGIQLLEAGLVT